MILSSYFVSKVLCRKLFDIMDGDTIVVQRIRIRFLQRVIAADMLYGLSNGRFRSVLLTKQSRKVATT